MIPSSGSLNTELKEYTVPTRTHKIIYDKNRVSGTIDEIEAVKQSIYLVLTTERYMYPIYSWNYGIELIDLIGQPVSFVKPELKRRITETLKLDNRIIDVSNFSFEVKGDSITTTFEVITIFGVLKAQQEVQF